MEKVNVSSTNISSVQYNESDESMVLEFKNGSSYKYKDVPLMVYKAFLTSSSKGQFFHSDIKRSFECVKLN